jgi:hypothetical protein
MVLCPCEHVRKKKQKGKPKKIEAGRRIDDKTFFLDGIKRNCNISITSFLYIASTTAHVCVACLRKWESWLKLTSKEDHAKYEKMQVPAPKIQIQTTYMIHDSTDATQAVHAESPTKGQCQQPTSAFDMMMHRGGGCVCVTGCAGRSSHGGSSHGSSDGADGAGVSSPPLCVDGPEAELDPGAAGRGGLERDEGAKRRKLEQLTSASVSEGVAITMHDTDPRWRRSEAGTWVWVEGGGSGSGSGSDDACMGAGKSAGAVVEIEEVEKLQEQEEQQQLYVSTLKDQMSALQAEQAQVGFVCDLHAVVM